MPPHYTIDRATFAARFWSFVNRPSPDACWEWQGIRHDQGYGTFCCMGKHWHAHRLSYELTNGPIPGRLCVLHRCDNRLCVNPAHLFLGTRTDNMADKVAKGRQIAPRGEQAGLTKLTTPQVQEIRRLYALGGTTQKKLARQFGVKKTCIYSILCRRTWKHLT